MDNKRPFDRARNAAGFMEVGASDDRSPITGFLKLGGALHILKEEGIYRVTLADEIDPARKNPTVPNVQQRVLRYGSNAAFVARTVQTASRLFDEKHFDKSINATSGVSLAFAAAQEFAAMQDIASEISNAQQHALQEMRKMPGSAPTVALPEIRHLTNRTKAFIQAMDHAYKALFETTEIFFGLNYRKRWFETFADYIDAKLPEGDTFRLFVRSHLPFLRLLRFMRDGIEHPVPHAQVVIRNFEMTDEGTIVLPTIEFIHSQTPLERSQLVSFMDQIIDRLGLIYEGTLAYLADRHVQWSGGFPVGVFEFSPTQLGEKHVRFSYGVMGHDGPIVFG